MSERSRCDPPRATAQRTGVLPSPRISACRREGATRAAVASSLMKPNHGTWRLWFLRHRRRELVSFGVTAHPTAEWLARQIAETFPWETAPEYIIRDRDGSYGAPFTRRVRAMGIRDPPVAPRSPWQNEHVERVIGSIRRECLDPWPTRRTCGACSAGSSALPPIADLRVSMSAFAPISSA